MDSKDFNCIFKIATQENKNNKKKKTKHKVSIK